MIFGPYEPNKELLVKLLEMLAEASSTGAAKFAPAGPFP